MVLCKETLAGCCHSRSEKEEEEGRRRRKKRGLLPNAGQRMSPNESKKNVESLKYLFLGSTLESL